MLPEWLWAIIVGGMMLGMVTYIWKSRNQGYLTMEFHSDICEKNRERINMDINKLSESFREALSVQYRNIQDLLNAKFEGLDQKIENTVLKEIRLINNGNGYSKPRSIRKRK